MAKGDDERFNSKRKVTREALGSRYAEIGVGFDLDPRVIQAIAEEKEMRGQTSWADIAGSLSEEEELNEANIDAESENTIRYADEASRQSSPQTRYLHDKDY